MSKLSKKDMQELREGCSYNCEYSATKDVVSEITMSTLKEMEPTNICMADDIGLLDWNEDEIGTLDDFVRIFWDKAVEKILNYVESQ